MVAQLAMILCTWACFHYALRWSAIVYANQILAEVNRRLERRGYGLTFGWEDGHP